MTNLTISTRLSGAFALLVLMVLGVTIAAMTQLAAMRSATAEITDDCSAVERLGKQVQLVSGDSENIKITRPMDLPMAEAILRAREGRA